MSIYATWLHLEEHGEHEVSCSRYLPATKEEAESSPQYCVTGEPSQYLLYDASLPCTCGERGPIVYQGSHVNPSHEDMRGGSLEVGVIPNHCHPDAHGSDEGPPVEFLRLSLDEDDSTYHGGVPGSATVALDRAQVQRLRDTLTAWLETDERW